MTTTLHAGLLCISLFSSICISNATKMESISIVAEPSRSLHPLKVIDELNTNGVFIRSLGSTSSRTDYNHLIIPIDLTHLQTPLEDIRHLIDTFPETASHNVKQSNLTPHVKLKVRSHCNNIQQHLLKELHNVEHLMSSLTATFGNFPIPNHRSTRGLLDFVGVGASWAFVLYIYPSYWFTLS